MYRIGETEGEVHEGERWDECVLELTGRVEGGGERREMEARLIVMEV